MISEKEIIMIHKICKVCSIYDYSINPDGSIDVNGDIDLKHLHLHQLLPLRFNYVDVNFDCSSNWLISLEDCPRHVSGNINLGTNQLTSLENSPIELGQYLYCYKNPLKSLVGYNLSYDKLVCDNKEKLIRKTKLKIIENL